MKKLPYDNPEIIEDLYWNQDLTQDKIALKYGVYQSAVEYFMKKNKISRRCGGIRKGSVAWRKAKEDWKKEQIKRSE